MYTLLTVLKDAWNNTKTQLPKERKITECAIKSVDRHNIIDVRQMFRIEHRDVNDTQATKDEKSHQSHCQSQFL